MKIAVFRYKLPFVKLLLYFVFSISCITFPAIFSLLVNVILGKPMNFVSLFLSITIVALLFFSVCYFAIDRIPLNNSFEYQKKNDGKLEYIIHGKIRGNLIQLASIKSVTFKNILFDKFCKTKSMRIILKYNFHDKSRTFSLLVSYEDYLKFRTSLK